MYRIVWTDVARAELRAIWYASDPSDDRLLIWAVSEFDFHLQRDPENVGESRSMGTRIMISRPLAVWYHVRPDNTVVIQNIWRHA